MSGPVPAVFFTTTGEATFAVFVPLPSSPTVPLPEHSTPPDGVTTHDVVAPAPTASTCGAVALATDPSEGATSAPLVNATMEAMLARNLRLFTREI